MSNKLSGYLRSSADANFYIQDLGTAAFYGLEFIDTAEDLVIPNQNMTCKPSVLIEGSKIVLDYGNCGSDKDKQFIDTLFTSMSTGHGFTLTNAIYSDIVNSYSADLAASCTLNSYTNYKVVSTFSAIGSTTETNYYRAENFETIPQIAATAGLTSGVTVDQIINYSTSNDNSFVSQGFVAGDYIDVSTSLNTGRHTIVGITVDALNREIVSLAGLPEVVQENLRTTETILEHRRKTYSNSTNPVNLNNIITHQVRVTPVGGKNYFEIDGSIQENLLLFRGNMYVFIEHGYSSHQLAFSTTMDGTWGGGSSFVDSGFYSVLDNSLGRRITIVVPNNNTPDQLYYYCTSHANMGGSTKISGSYTYSNIPSIITNINSTTSATSSSSAGSAY